VIARQKNIRDQSYSEGPYVFFLKRKVLRLPSFMGYCVEKMRIQADTKSKECGAITELPDNISGPILSTKRAKVET